MKTKLQWFRKTKGLKEETGGSLVEYGLIIGFAIFAFALVVTIILGVVDWAANSVGDFLKKYAL
jgi:Flp pilus assembly pilin Flp